MLPNVEFCLQFMVLYILSDFVQSHDFKYDEELGKTTEEEGLGYKCCKNDQLY